jgi:hypothetical protein
MSLDESGNLAVAGTLGVTGTSTLTGGLSLANTTAAPTNGVSNPPALTFDGFGWDSNSGSDPIQGKIEFTAAYGDYGAGATQGALKFSIKGAGGTDSSPETLIEGMRLTGHTQPRLGIGTTSPATLLNIKGATASSGKLLIESGTLTNNNQAALLMAATNVNGHTGNVSIECIHPNNQQSELVIRTGATTATAFGTERMRIDTDGNVGIGTDSPDAKFEVEWTGTHVSTDSIARITAPIYPALEFYSTNTNSNNRNWKISSVYNTYGTLEFLKSSAANGVPQQTVMSMDKDGNVTVSTGNLVIGVAGKGIDFSNQTQFDGTTTAEILDHYEEGTWTPTLLCSTTNPTYTLDANRCHYTRIGNLVTVVADISWNITNVGSGDFTIGGLPFATANWNYHSLNSARDNSLLPNISAYKLASYAYSTLLPMYYHPNTTGPSAYAAQRIIYSDLVTGVGKRICFSFAYTT